MKLRILLRSIGILSIGFSLLGFFDLLQLIKQYYGTAAATPPLLAVWVCNAIFDILLLMAGIQLIRRPSAGRVLALWVLGSEVAYFLIFFVASLIAPHAIASAISNAFGVGGRGLS